VQVCITSNAVVPLNEKSPVEWKKDQKQGNTFTPSPTMKNETENQTKWENEQTNKQKITSFTVLLLVLFE